MGSEHRVQVVAYTDGGCRGNPGPGGWGVLLVDRRSGSALERWGGEPETTNNRMEMTAAIEALRSLRRPGHTIEIRSDSRYLVDMCTSWIAGWKRRGWKRKGGPIRNLDLVRELDALMERHDVRWRWVPGHAGEPGNERVDQLANAAMDRLASGASPAGERRHEESPVRIPD